MVAAMGFEPSPWMATWVPTATERRQNILSQKTWCKSAWVYSKRSSCHCWFFSNAFQILRGRWLTAGVGKQQPAGRMCPATAFSVARGSTHENIQI